MPYSLTWKRHTGPMPGACEACDAMSMERDATCSVGLLGEVTARVLCPACVIGASASLADGTVLAAAFGSSPIEGTFTPDRMAKARAAKAAKRALQEVERASAGSVS